MNLLAGNFAMILGMFWFSLAALILWGGILTWRFMKRCANQLFHVNHVDDTGIDIVH